MKGTSIVLQTFSAVRNLKRKQGAMAAKSLQQMVSNEVGCRVPSTAQAGSSFNMDTFEEHIRQFASLPSFLESCSIKCFLIDCLSSFSLINIFFIDEMFLYYKYSEK
jgi:hypothetical protein